MYSAAINPACFSGTVRLPGQPPRTIYCASLRSSTSPVIVGESSPRHKSFKEMLPEEKPASNRLIGRIRSRPIRPAPLCRIPFRFGVAEPVRINCPFALRTSISARTASHKGGTSCHSSSKRGVLPVKTVRGDISARCLF